MAIVKANYVKRGATERAGAKATIRYIQERPGISSPKQMRQLFGADGPYTREQVYALIDEAEKGTIFYRFVISPDPRSEDSIRDLDLSDLTIQTLVHLEERMRSKVLFAAAQHNDHTPNRHVHVLALLNRKLTLEDLQALRQSATELSLLQRRMRDLGAERKLAPSLTRTLTPKLATKRMGYASRFYIPRPRDKRGGIAPPKRGLPCPRACSGYGQTMEHLYGRLHKCPSCGIIVRKNGRDVQIQEQTFSLSRTL